MRTSELHDTIIVYHFYYCIVSNLYRGGKETTCI